MRITLCFFFNDTATTEIYTLSLHDALPISAESTGSGKTAGPAEKLWIRCTVTESVEREGELGLEV